MRSVLVSLLVLNAYPAAGQSLDPSRFLPLDVGNAWHFAGKYSATLRNGSGGVSTVNATFSETYEVTGTQQVRDTVYATVQVWRTRPRYSTAYAATELWRYDARLAAFMSRDSSGVEQPVLGVLYSAAMREEGAPLDPPFGWTETARVYAKAGDFQCGLGGVRLQYERGPYDISSSGGSPYGCSSSAKLVYARLSGAEYGQRIATSAEATPVPASTLQLWPNPARGAATVAAAAGADVHVFDLLGRHVLRTTTGADGQAMLPLAPGRYVVRAGSEHQKLIVH